jgi:hypothetical protein
LFAVKVKNRAVNNFSAICCGLVPDWDGAEWTGLQETDNPSPHLRDIMTGNLNLSPIPMDIVDDASLLGWRTFCSDNSLGVNADAEQTTVADAEALCCAAGHAVLRASDTWGVAWEYDRTADSPVQMFSQRNSANYNWSVTFDHLPDALLVTYADAQGNAQQVTVMDDGVTVPKRTNTVTYDYINNETQAIAQAKQDLRLARLRNVRHTLDVDAEAINCQRGDLIAFQHDSLSKHVGSARIVSTIKSGSEITGLLLDSAVPVVSSTVDLNASPDVSLEPDISELGMIRTSEGEILTKQLTGTTVRTNEVYFETPFEDPGTIDTGNLVTVGPLTQEYKRMVLFGISMGQDLGATLLLLDEAPGIHAP